MNLEKYKPDIECLLSKRLLNGGDFWTTPEGGLANGGPFSTLEACNLLLDLGTPPDDPILLDCANALFQNWKEDGRIRTYSQGALYPCQTANAARILCKLGFREHLKLEKTYQYFLASQEEDGGWRCNASKYGKGPETQSSNPGPTLTILEIFSYTQYLNRDERLDKAAEFLLKHWETKNPLGPCHFGIGTLFMKVEYPLTRYNLLNYVYVLSYYEKAVNDPRFKEAYEILRSKLVDGMLVIENTNRKLKEFISCRVLEKSELATKYYTKIVENIKSLT